MYSHVVIHMKALYIFMYVCKNGSRWCNGLARWQQWLCYLQGPEFESHLRPVDFFSCNKVSPLTNSNPQHLCHVLLECSLKLSGAVEVVS